MELFWTFALVSSALLVLVFSVRNRAVAWGWNVLLIVLILYAGLYKLTGTPRDAWLFAIAESKHGEMQVAYHAVVPNHAIYLVLRSSSSDQPYYLRLPWSQQLQQQIEQAAMQAREQQTPLMVDVDKLSRGQFDKETKGAAQASTGKPKRSGGSNRGGDNDDAELMFYPKPVPPDPFKTPAHTEIQVR